MRFTVFEGPDGSGKTSLAKALAERTGAVYIKTPGEEYKSIRKYIDNGTPPETKLLFYLSSVCDASAKIRRTLENQPVVCDRYIWSSLIPHAAYFDKDLGELERNWKHITDSLVVPDETIFTFVDESEQVRRLHEDRGLSNPTASDLFCLQEETRSRVRDMYSVISQRENWTKVDTTRKTVEETLDGLQSRVYGGIL